MKKLLIASIILLTIGVVKTSGSGAARRRIQYSNNSIDLLLEIHEQKDHLFVEDGVYVKPSYAIDLFEPIFTY